MTIKKRLNRILSLAISLALAAMPLAAQKRKDAQPAPKEAPRAQPEAPTFDNLLAADDYKIYGEIKNVGQLIRSPNIADVLDPLMKLASPPKEFKSLVKFANAHAELLTTSRMLFASWPAKRKIPQALWVIEFSSPDEAKKFEPQLREFLPSILPAPPPAIAQAVIADPRAQIRSSTAVAAVDLLEVKLGEQVEVLESIEVQDAQDKAKKERWSRVRAHDDKRTEGWIEARHLRPPDGVATATNRSAPSPGDAKGAGGPEVKQTDNQPAPPPFVIKQLGNLVLISDTPFSLKNLRPANSELLFDNPNFRQAHDRLGSEQVFLFINVALDEHKGMVPTDVELSQQTGKPQTVVVGEPLAITVKDSGETPSTEATANSRTVVEQRAAAAEPPTPMDADSESPEEQAVLVAGSSAPQAGTGVGPDLNFNFGMMMGSIFGGTPKLPDAVGVAIAFEGDSYAARVLLVGGPDGKASPVPFISQWVSGPALTLESPSILPADTELLVAASLDTPQIYEGLVKTLTEQAASFQRASRQPHNETQPVGPFADLEKKVGLKIKEDLLPVLGNEFAVSVPVNTFTGTPAATATPAAGEEKDQAATKKTPRSPVFLISVKDKEAARTLVPRIIEGLGFKGAAMLAQKERRDDTEIVSYAGVFSYAFVANFLVVSLDTDTTRHVVDSYLAHQTLSSESQFRNSTRWQPRQLLGQIYVSPALMESYRTNANNPTALVSDKVREFLTRLSPVSEPVTYSLSSDGLGPLHELHVPRNLILMMVAGISDETNQSPLVRNEQTTRAALMMIANSETIYQKDLAKGQYGSLEQLADHQLVSKEMFRDHGYRVELIASGNKFTATAVPIEYNKTGRLSYFVDETGVIRGADHGGAPATVSDGPVQ